MQLFNYVYGSEDDDESIVVFGIAMMYNHRNPKTVEHLWCVYRVYLPDLLRECIDLL
jgi:hypothetical protein